MYKVLSIENEKFKEFTKLGNVFKQNRVDLGRNVVNYHLNVTDQFFKYKVGDAVVEVDEGSNSPNNFILRCNKAGKKFLIENGFIPEKDFKGYSLTEL